MAPRSRRTRRFAAVATGVTLILLLAGCGTSVTGRAVSIYSNPFTVAGLPATSGPSGPRPGVPDAVVDVQNYAGTEADVLAVNAIDDVVAYWQEQYGRYFPGRFEPVTTLISWDAGDAPGRAPQFCGEDTGGELNAAFCSRDMSIGWDRGQLLPALIDEFGPMSVVMVLAHEYGHAIQEMAGLGSGPRATIVDEQQADCFAGAFMRHVAEGKSAHFTLNTSDGLNSVLAATVAVRDSDPGAPDAVHGSAFERVTASQIGFADGPGACGRIDAAEVQSRRGDLPTSFDDPRDTGETAVTRDSVQAIVDALGVVAPTSPRPVLDFSGSDLHCPDAAATSPVSYCPATHTIGVDLPALVERGTPPRPRSDEVLPVEVIGDFSAYVVLMSRYMLATLANEGTAVTDAPAALRSACLVGVATAALSPERAAEGVSIMLSPGDLDEAVSGLLTDGLAASDVDGNTVPSGFSRIDAFRSGVLGDADVCGANYG